MTFTEEAVSLTLIKSKGAIMAPNNAEVSNKNKSVTSTTSDFSKMTTQCNDNTVNPEDNTHQEKDTLLNEGTKDPDGQPEQAVVPDGGWGWVLVVGMGIGLGINAGFNKSVTLFYQQVLIRYRRSAAVTAGLTSTSGTLRMVLSPLASALCNRTSHKTVGVLGGIISSLAYILTGFMPSVSWMYLTFGVLQGIGCCMCIVSGNAVINMYFSKNRGKANALSRCFLGVGALVMTQLLSVFFEEYGFTGTLLIVGAIALNLVPASLLLRPLEKPKKSKISTQEDNLEEVDCEPEKAVNSPENNYEGLDSETENNVFHINSNSNVQNLTEQQGGDTAKGTVKKQDVVIIQVTDTGGESSSDTKTKPRICSRVLNCFWLAIKKFASVLGFTAFKNIRFSFLAILMASYCLVNSINMSLLAGLAIEKGYKQSQVTLLMTLNFASEIPFRLLSGVVMDLKVVRTRRLIVFASVSLVIGVLLLCQPFIPMLIPSMMLWMLQNGLMGAFQTQANTVMCDLVPRSAITSSIGLMRLIQGIGNLSGPILGGLLYDLTGYYSLGYVFAGAQMTVLGMVFIIVVYCCKSK